MAAESDLLKLDRLLSSSRTNMENNFMADSNASVLTAAK